MSLLNSYMDNSQFKAIFLQETYQRLSGIEKGLLLLEADPKNASAPASIDKLFRHYHSIKGMCASMGYEKMKGFAHAQENLLDDLRKTGKGATGEMVSVLLSSLDVLKEMTRRIEQDLPLDDMDPSSFIKTMKDIISPAGAGGARDVAHSIGLPDIMNVNKSVFDELLKITGDLLRIMSGLKPISARLKSIELKELVYGLGKNVERLRSNILSARMVPFDNLTETLPRIVRDVSKKDGKETLLKIEGADLTLDRSILESMADPLVHLIRNAVDHGIETPVERTGANKPGAGTITLSVAGEKDRVVITLTDDGRGIDCERLKGKAREMGMDREKLERLSDEEALMLVCVPGLSLSGSITDVSGRGVGMDIVKNAVEGIGGTLKIQSVPGRGTSVFLELPRSASIIDVLFVRVGAEIMGIPSGRIEKVVEAENAGFAYGGKSIPAKKLKDIMGIAEEDKAAPKKAIIINAPKGPFSLLVDGVENEVNAYIRPLIPPFAKLWGVSGFTVTSDGRPVFLLDVAEVASRIF